MREATDRERMEILQAYEATMGYPSVEDCGNPQIGVLPQYSTSGPGYVGPLAVIFWPGCEDWITLMKWKAGQWELSVDTATLIEDRAEEIRKNYND